MRHQPKKVSLLISAPCSLCSHWVVTKYNSSALTYLKVTRHMQAFVENSGGDLLVSQYLFCHLDTLCVRV